MLDAKTFREITSGRRRSLCAGLMRTLLRAAEVPYTWAVRWRNRRYDNGRAESFRVDAPVISVGNLTLGGSGKTPMVEWIGRWMRNQGVPVAIVSRGYKSRPGSPNDEALELAQALPGVPHLQNPDRVAAARQAIEHYGRRLILLDDGFQHRRLARDMDIVLLDALAPFGYGHVFPRGMLREPLEGLSRADVVVLSRADLVDEQRRDEIRRTAARHAPAAIWAEAVHAPEALRSAAGEEIPLESLRNSRLAAFCGIGNPDGFRRTLQRLGYSCAGFREFPDHHAYSDDDAASLAEWAQRERAEALVCTNKDLVKLNVNQIEGRPLWAVRIGLQFQRGEAEVVAKLRESSRCTARERSGIASRELPQ